MSKICWYKKRQMEKNEKNQKRELVYKSRAIYKLQQKNKALEGEVEDLTRQKNAAVVLVDEFEKSWKELNEQNKALESEIAK